MSNIERIENLKQIVRKVQPDFEQLAMIHKAVDYAREASFAIEALNNNGYLAQVAMADQDSLKRAVVNVAAIGLTLNPVLKLAYLVPRNSKVCLDVSYRGYVHLAVEIGALKWVVAVLVHEKDEYLYQGEGREPIHKFNPFQEDRGKIVGVYCLAKTQGDEFILTQMPAAEVFAIRDRSASWKAFQKDKSKLSPWNTDEGEMIKKTVIKRAAKSWPLSDMRERFDRAIDITNEADPVLAAAPQPEDSSKELSTIREMLSVLNRTEAEFLEYLIRTNRRDLKRLEDLTPQEASKAVVILNQTLELRKKQEGFGEKAS